MTNRDKVPVVCFNCENLENEYDEMSDRTSYYCIKNVFFPVHKNACKKFKKEFKNDPNNK